MAKALEEKLDNYILEFVNLNNSNKLILEETHEILESRFKDHLRALKINSEEAMQKLLKENSKESDAKDIFKREIEVYVKQLHADVEETQEKI